MFRKLVRLIKAPIVFVLKRPIIWFSQRVSSSPQKEAVFERLSEIYEGITSDSDLKEGAMYDINLKDGRSTIILTDHHKGNRRGGDEFRHTEGTYLAALDYYDQKDSYYINLGDSEELWKYNIFSIMKKNKATFEAEKKFVKRKAFFKLYGNHDIFWKIDPFASFYLWQLYGKPINIYGGIVIRVNYAEGHYIDFFCTHGHQGDSRSDGNWFSKWFVAYIWGPLQSFLEININTPALSQQEKTYHNQLMYEWSQNQKNLVLITGHTHQTIFHSYSHIQWLKQQLSIAQDQGLEEEAASWQEKINRHPSQCDGRLTDKNGEKPTYFNAGCCCFNDGSMSGIEISGGQIALVRWANEEGEYKRKVLEALPLIELHHLFYD
ncbi:metallophosphoesterase [Pararhodonellum marinum]|uniref:metallophosphoesterase n=1 Tax=Pararhodonellum marinum TaxID=2755358 RepID=UPI00188F87E7|nr:metallophosphoesterase [Pararhodonellum marinum]